MLSILLGWKSYPSRDEISGHSQEIKFYWRTRNWWHVDDNGLIWYKWYSHSSRFCWKLIVPGCLKMKVMEAVHDNPSGGHFGEKRSVSSLLRLPVFWFHHKADMRMHCRTCDDCLRCKPEIRKARSLINSFTVGEPLQRMAVDIIRPLHAAKKGNKYIAVVMDYFTKWVELIPLPDHTCLLYTSPSPRDS